MAAAAVVERAVVAVAVTAAVMVVEATAEGVEVAVASMVGSAATEVTAAQVGVARGKPTAPQWSGNVPALSAAV